MRSSLQGNRAGSPDRAHWMGATMGDTRLAKPGSHWREGEGRGGPQSSLLHWPAGTLVGWGLGGCSPTWHLSESCSSPGSSRAHELLRPSSRWALVSHELYTWNINSGNEVCPSTGWRMLFILFSLLKPTLFWVSLTPPDSPRLQAKAIASANHHCFSDTDGMVPCCTRRWPGPWFWVSNMTNTCSFGLLCRTCSIGRARSSSLKGQGRAQMSHLCHNNYMNLMMTEFSQPCGTIQHHFPNLHTALPLTLPTW